MLDKYKFKQVKSDMNEQHILAVIISNKNETITMSEAYNDQLSVEHYLTHFTEQAQQKLAGKIVEVIELKITQHEEDGAYKYDEFNNRLFQVIYQQV